MDRFGVFSHGDSCFEWRNRFLEIFKIWGDFSGGEIIVDFCGLNVSCMKQREEKVYYGGGGEICAIFGFSSS